MISDLPKCPDCGQTPEFNWKIRQVGMCAGALKCPYSHIRVQMPFMAGHKALAQKELVKMWKEAVAIAGKELGTSPHVISINFKVE